MGFNVKVIGCSTAWTNRPMSSYCLDNETLIDCGEGTTKYYNNCGVDFLEIKNIFITHFHSDHILGLTEFLCQHCIYHNDKPKYLTIYGPKGLRKHLNLLKVFAFGKKDAKIIDLEKYISIVELDGGCELKVGDYVINTFKLKHGNLIDIAYSFKKDNFTIGFSGDCTYTKNLEKFVSKSDICFLVCCAEKTTENHLGCDKFLEIKKRYKNNRYIAIHSIDRIYNKKYFDIEFAISGKIYNFEKNK